MSRSFAIRYKVEPWGKPVEEPVERVLPGIQVTESDYGYADAVFVASIIRDKNGNPISVLLMDSDDGPSPSRKMLSQIRAAIDHYLQEHCPK